MKNHLIPVIALLVSTSLFGAPERSKGISMHMLPDRVAKISGKEEGGFIDSYAPYLAPEKKEPLLRSSGEFKAFVEKQKKEVKQNGVWIVTTNPASYSDEEKKLLDEISKSFSGAEVPIFVCRGSDLPDGWKQTNE